MKLLSILLPSRPVSYFSLKPEQKICVEFASDLRQLTIQRKLPYVWFHIPNEYMANRHNFVFEMKQHHMGKLRGVPDYAFLGKNDSFFIEFKAGKAKLSESQEIFQEWCQSQGVDYFLCRSAQEGMEVVKER
jgi:hypothetical protein